MHKGQGYFPRRDSKFQRQEHHLASLPSISFISIGDRCLTWLELGQANAFQTDLEKRPKNWIYLVTEYNLPSNVIYQSKISLNNKNFKI